MDEHTLLQRHVMSVSGCGGKKRTLYLWHTKDGYYCQAGCFFGTETSFVEAVQAKYGEDAYYIKAFQLLKLQTNTAAETANDTK